MAKFTPPVLRGLLKKPGRHPDEEAKGPYFRAVGDGKAYWVYRYRLHGHEREMSLGPYPEVKLADARAKHAELRAKVLKKSDPLAGKRALMPTTPSGKPTFGAMADDYQEPRTRVAQHKHRAQWSMTLTVHARAIRDTPVDQVTTTDVLGVLRPLWIETPETASRLRGRVESVINAARALGHLPEDKANPARWKGHLDHLLPKPKKLSRGHHAAMPYADLPQFMTRLREMPGVASPALEFLILTATRTSETLNATWEEIDFEAAIWRVPAVRMKMGKPSMCRWRTGRSPFSTPSTRRMEKIRTSSPAGQRGRCRI